MRGPVFSPIHVGSAQLHILSHQFRLYVGLSRGGEYLHVIAPRQTESFDADGNVVQPAGALACNCKGGVWHGDCWRLRQAIAYEAGEAIEELWFGDVVAPETELEKAAARG